MATIETILFEQFADLLNEELASTGATFRVARATPGLDGTMMLQDANGRLLGAVPDHVDTATIAAFEAILAAHDADRRRS